MRKIYAIVTLTALLCLTVPMLFAKPPAAPKSGPGTIVIIFKDGHRQSFNLSEIARVEFPAAAEASGEASSALLPSRNRFLGKWEVGDGSGNNFFITLKESGDALRSLGDIHGKWVYVGGEARVTWDDGAQDAIRKVDTNYQKFAYRSGRSCTDVPDNVTSAHNSTAHPI